MILSGIRILTRFYFSPTKKTQTTHLKAPLLLPSRLLLLTQTIALPPQSLSDEKQFLISTDLVDLVDSRYVNIFHPQLIYQFPKWRNNKFLVNTSDVPNRSYWSWSLATKIGAIPYKLIVILAFLHFFFVIFILIWWSIYQFFGHRKKVNTLEFFKNCTPFFIS